jgi:hypothetical protein
MKRGLVEVAGFFAFFCFFIEPQNFVNYFYVGEQHTSATVAFEAKAVEYVTGVFAGSDSAGEFVPSVAYQLAAGEASDWDNHVSFSPIGNSSVPLNVRLRRRLSWFL